MTENKKTKHLISRRDSNLDAYIVLGIFSLISIFPLYMMLVSSTNTSTEYLQGKLWFGHNLMENYRNLIAGFDVWTAMKNSLKYSVLQTVLCLTVCSIAGYGFEIYHSRAKDRVMTIILLAMMIPFAAIMVPLYQAFSGMGLLNTALGFVLPSISTPFMIMFFRQNARSFPSEIIEAARIEGMSEFGIFLKMFLPTMRSTFAAAATVVFMNAWNSFMWPKIVLSALEKRTMPMLVASVISGYTVDFGVLMLSVTLTTLPTVIIFLVLQKSFANGIVGSVK